MTKAQSSSFVSHELLQCGSWLPICSFTSPSVFDFCSFPFLFLPLPQIPQDSPEQEASKSPRGAVPVSTEASLPPEATPQLSLQSTTPIANYSQVSTKEKDRILMVGDRGGGGVHEWKSKTVRREGIVKLIKAKMKTREEAEIAETENEEEVNFNAGLDWNEDKGIKVLDGWSQCAAKEGWWSIFFKENGIWEHFFGR